MVYKSIISHMENEFPKEGCGILLKSGKWIPCENRIDEVKGSDEVENGTAFYIDFATYIEHSGNIKEIIHSHITDSDDGCEPSASDMIHQQATGVKWTIVQIGSDGKFLRSNTFGESVV